MVSLIVNGRPYESSAASLLELLYEAEGYLDEGHAISRVLVDGAETHLDAGLLQTPTDAIHEVRVESARVKSLLLLGIGLMRQFLLETSAGIGAVALSYRMSRTAEGDDALAPVLAGLENLLEMLQGVNESYPRALLALDDDVIGLDLKMRELSRTLRTIRAARERSDWTQTADILDHQLAPAAQEWREILGQLAVEIEKAKERGRGV
ncbi:MAG: hypothetical protein AB1714_30590 [Acidobacteriota bacterium]